MRKMPLPESLGRLRRLRRIGAGAFASVWLYRDDELDSDVAVKALADNWADQLDVAERFVQEARVLRAAKSDHVVTVHDIGETDDGIPYFVMDHADLGTVADLVGAGTLDLETTVTIVEQAAQGLADLHAAGVVHRDVKPQNLLLRSDRRLGRRVLVADLGLAKELAFASGMTQRVGTPAYMAPEQARTGARIDERADVHALGAVAYHLLCGTPLRDGSMTDVSTTRPTPLTAIMPVSEAVDAVVMRAVRIDPDRRPRDPLAFAAALRSAAGEAAPDDVPTLLEKPTKVLPAAPTVPWHRSPLVRLVAALLVALGVAALVALILTRPDPEDDGRAGRGAGTTSSGTGEAGDYCTTLRARRDDLAELGSADPDQLREGVAALHALRQAAPAEVEDAWARLDDPFVRLEETLASTGTTWEDFIAAPSSHPQVAAAARRATESFERSVDAERAIEQHADRTCGDLD